MAPNPAISIDARGKLIDLSMGLTFSAMVNNYMKSSTGAADVTFNIVAAEIVVFNLVGITA